MNYEALNTYELLNHTIGNADPLTQALADRLEDFVKRHGDTPTIAKVRYAHTIEVRGDQGSLF